jgi:hypothetical protein
VRGITAFSAVAALWLASASTGMAAPSLTVLCGVDEMWCAAMKTAYEAKTGLDISVTRKSTGDILNQIRAEKAAPTVDVWWGGTGDTHLQAGSENLLEPYQPAHERDMLTTPYVFSADEAVAMTKAGADMIVPHMGLTTGGSIGAETSLKLADCPAIIDEWAEAAKKVRKDVMVICHGGPISSPDDAAYILKNTKNVHGFYGASSMERLPTETALTQQTKAFKKISF